MTSRAYKIHTEPSRCINRLRVHPTVAFSSQLGQIKTNTKCRAPTTEREERAREREGGQKKRALKGKAVAFG